MKKSNEEIAKNNYPKIDFLIKSWKTAKVLMYFGLALILVNLFISFACTKNPYAWSVAANCAFFSLTRSTYALGWMIIAFYVIFGHTNVGKIILTNPGMTACGRLVYISYLISPIVMMIVYSNTDHGIFMSMAGNVTLGMGHMMISIIAGAMIYVTIQWQIMRSI